MSNLETLCSLVSPDFGMQFAAAPLKGSTNDLRKGASIYDVRADGTGVDKCPKCMDNQYSKFADNQHVKFADREEGGGVKKSNNIVDVIYRSH